MGFGHAMRILSLAERLIADQHEVVFFTAQCPEKVLDKAPERMHVVLDEQLHGVVPEQPGAITVVDSHKMKAPDCGIQINNAWWFLRRELDGQRRHRTECRKILVSCGGSFALESGTVTDQDNGLGLIFRLTSFETYAESLAWCDVAIGAGGVSSLERAYLGIPSLIVLIAENQRANRDWLTARLAGIKVAHQGELEQAEWISCLAQNPELVSIMSRKAMAAVPNDSYQAFWTDVRRRCMQ